MFDPAEVNWNDEVASVFMWDRSWEGVCQCGQEFIWYELDDDEMVPGRDSYTLDGAIRISSQHHIRTDIRPDTYICESCRSLVVPAIVRIDIPIWVMDKINEELREMIDCE